MIVLILTSTELFLKYFRGDMNLCDRDEFMLKQ